MHLIANVIKILQAKFHCNRLTTVQDIQDYASLIFGTHRRLYYNYVSEYVYGNEIQMAPGATNLSPRPT